MHTNTTRATQNATLPRRNRQNPTLYQHILSDLAVEANQLKTPVSPTTATKTRNKNNTKCPITPKIRDKNNTKCPIARTPPSCCIRGQRGAAGVLIGELA